MEKILSTTILVVFLFCNISAIAADKVVVIPLSGRTNTVFISTTSYKGDSTVPKPPGHDIVTGPFTILAVGIDGVSMQWGRPTANTDGSLISGVSGTNDLEGGGFLIFRGDSPNGTFSPVGILEDIGSESVYSYTDSDGTTKDFYFIVAFDTSGNQSAKSALQAADPTIHVPNMITNVNAFAATTEGAIDITWISESTATDGYRIYRSERRDGGYTSLSETLPSTTTTFTDTDSELNIGRTYWYKVAGVSATSGSTVLEGSPSTAAPATPGPTDGIYYLEAEDATVIQYSNSTDWDSLNRQAFPAPFHSRGILFVDPSVTATPGTTFVTLQWSKEVDSSGPGGSVQTYDVFINVNRNSSSGIFDLFIQEPISGTSAISRNGFDFFLSSFGFPLQPELIFLGQINFVDEDFAGGNPTNETINCRLGYQGANAAVAMGNGELLFDGLVLVRK